MSQLLHLEFFLKDQKAVKTFRDIISRYDSKVVASGGTLPQTFVNQDDPNHLIYSLEWESRTHQAEYMKWLWSQPNVEEEVSACFASPPRELWLGTLAGESG